MATATARTRVINLRTDEARRSLIDRAAEALAKDRTEFMLDAATREAQSVLSDPVMVLVRLAVDRAHQGTGLGSALLRDALLRTLAVAEAVGIRAILLHAISEEAKRFYVHHGFAQSPVDPLTMMITLADVEKAMGISPDRYTSYAHRRNG